MATSIEHQIMQADKLTVFTANDEVNKIVIRKYIIKHWKTLTQEMDNSTILFVGGIHGKDTSELGQNVKIQTMKNQVSCSTTAFDPHLKSSLSVQAKCFES